MGAFENYKIRQLQRKVNELENIVEMLCSKLQDAGTINSDEMKKIDSILYGKVNYGNLHLYSG